MIRKLTETAVSRAPVPTTGQTMIWDTGRGSVTGFAVRILPGGSRTFWYQYRSPGGRSGTNRMVRIGAFPTITLAAARKRARDLAGQAARGQDPAAERAEAKRRNSSTLRSRTQQDGARRAAGVRDVACWHSRDIARSRMDFRFLRKSGRAADITAR